MMAKSKKWVVSALVIAILVAGPLVIYLAGYPISIGGTIVFAARDNGGAYQGEENFELSDEHRQALERIYEIVPELKKLTEKSTYRDENTWGVYLDEAKGNEVATFLSANARLVFEIGTGELLLYSFHNPDWASGELPTREFAVQQADNFIKQVLVDNGVQYLANSCRSNSGIITDGKGNEISLPLMSLRYYPLINGLPFLYDGGAQVEVGAAGHIVGYERYGSIERPKEELDISLFVHPDQAIINPADAEQIIAEEITMELTYLPEGSFFNKQEKPVLAYMGSVLPLFIDAMTGKAPYWYGVDYMQMGQIILKGQWKEMAVQNQGEAEILLSQHLGVDIDKMERVETSREYNEAGFYNWRKAVKPELPGSDWSWHTVTLQMQPDTGELINIRTDDSGELIKPAVLSQEDALALAVSFMEKVLPEGAAEMSVVAHRNRMRSDNAPDWADVSLLERGKGNNFDDFYPMYVQSSNYTHFSFISMRQGIPIYGSDYNVTVSLVTGKVTGYNRGNIIISDDFPDAGYVVSAAQAKAELLRNTRQQLVYMLPAWNGQKPPAPLLFYTTDYNDDWHLDYIDALTGKAVLSN